MNTHVSTFLAGVAVGCGFALWLGTREGRRFRVQMQRRAARSAERLKESGANLRDQVMDAARKGSDGISTQAAGLAAGFEAGRRA